MVIKYNGNIENQAVIENLHRLINQTYKLLPTREEGQDWQKPLETIVEELAGMDQLLLNHHEILFMLLCKLQGLTTLLEEKDFALYRRTIFECLGALGELKAACQV